MILPDYKLVELGEAGMVRPFDHACVNPASIDLRVDGDWYDLGNNKSGSGVVRLVPGVVMLVSTVEALELPDDVAGQLVLKSSMGRRGVMMPAAGWVDPGFVGTLTVQLSSAVPILLQPGDRFLQLVLWRMMGKPDQPYRGKYQGQRGVTLDRSPIQYPEPGERLFLV